METASMKRQGMHKPTRLTLRLVRVLNFLRERGYRGCTTWEAQKECQICGGVAFRELRAMGYQIDCQFVSREPWSGARVYRYILRREP